MPFRLVYDTKAVTPVEITITSQRVQHFNPKGNDIKIWTNHDLAKKKWSSEETQANMRLATTQYFKKKVNARQFFVRLLVMRHDEFTNLDCYNTLSRKWEGPCKVIEIVAPISYYLEYMEGIRLPLPF